MTPKVDPAGRTRRWTIPKKYVNSLFAVLLGLIAGAFFMLAIGRNPFVGYFYLFKGGVMNLKYIGQTLATSTPLILTGLSVAFAFRTGLFNIGAAGQMLMGGLTAIGLALTFEHMLPRGILLAVIVLGSIVAGGLWALIAGVLKARFNVNEVVATIMLNWIAFWTVKYGVYAFFRDPQQETQSKAIDAVASLKAPWLTSLFPGSYINLGLFLSLIALVIIALVLDKTTLGYELKAVGFNRSAAEYAGIKVNRGVILSMTIAGMLAGLAGATYWTGYSSNMQIDTSSLPSQGLDGIAVALLGTNSPVGVLFAAVFFGMLQSGKGFMTAVTGIPPEIADTIIATVIYFAAAAVLIERVLDAWRKRRASKALAATKKGGEE